LLRYFKENYILERTATERIKTTFRRRSWLSWERNTRTSGQSIGQFYHV